MRHAIVITVALLSLACSGGIAEVSPLVLSHRPDTPPEIVVTQLAELARQQGYAPIVVQPHRGRFAVQARYADRFGGYVITFVCEAGAVNVEVIGARVERFHRSIYLPEPLRNEVGQLAEAMRQLLSRI
jgi:hypothetical protein